MQTEQYQAQLTARQVITGSRRFAAFADEGELGMLCIVHFESKYGRFEWPQSPSEV
jgi:hypothetical protein